MAQRLIVEIGVTRRCTHEFERRVNELLDTNQWYLVQYSIRKHAFKFICEAMLDNTPLQDNLDE